MPTTFCSLLVVFGHSFIITCSSREWSCLGACVYEHFQLVCLSIHPTHTHEHWATFTMVTRTWYCFFGWKVTLLLVFLLKNGHSFGLSCFGKIIKHKLAETNTLNIAQILIHLAAYIHKPTFHKYRSIIHAQQQSQQQVYISWVSFCSFEKEITGG